MIHELRADMDLADVEIHRLELLDFDLAGKIVKRDGEKGHGHLAFENFLQAVVRAVVAENLNLILVVVRGHKEGEALNMIPMNVCDEQSQINCARSEFVFQG